MNSTAGDAEERQPDPSEQEMSVLDYRRCGRPTWTVLLYFTCIVPFSAHAQSASKSFKDLTGIWAPSAADCKDELGGNKSYSELKFKFLIGVCEQQIEYLRQPASCRISKVVNRGDTLSFSAACEEKDYPRTKSKSEALRIEDATTISFPDQDFVFAGTYHRCSASYKCVRRK